MNDEFVLFETTETHDVDYSWGEVSSEKRGYRLVLLVQDSNVSFEYQSGAYVGEDIEWEECEVFDIDFAELDWSEISRLETELSYISTSKMVEGIKRAKENVQRLIPIEKGE